MHIDHVLVLSQRNSQVWKHMSADVAHGFRCLGLDVQFVEELHNGPKDTMDYWKDIVRCQLEFKPQLIFQMGHLRFAYPYGMWSGDAVMATWVQDWHHWTLGVEAQGSIPNAEQVALFNASKDLIFFSFPALGEAIKKQGYDPARVHFLPPGANFDRFYPAPMPDGRFTVGFACNVGAPMTSGDPVRLERRLTPVRWLLELGVPVKLWGKGWETMPEFAPHWHGLVANGPELRRAYQSTHATLHANTDLVLYHQRPMESLACGRCVLAYGKPEFELPGIVGFQTKEQVENAVEMVRGWPPDEDGMPLLAAEKHNYPTRCRTILDAVSGL